MNHSGPRTRLAAASVLLVVLTTRAYAAGTDPSPPGDRLVGAAASARLVGNTIVGRTPDGPYAEYVAPDGSLIHVDQDGKVAGTWVSHDPQFCLTLPDEDGEDCRSIEVTGDRGAFVDPGGNRYLFDILPGNAKGL